MVARFNYISLDDEPAAHSVLRHLMKAHSDFEDCGAYYTPGEAMTAITEKMPNLLFLDIEMPSMSGLDFLRQFKPPVATIMVTAHANFALEGFDVGVRDYLLKPMSAERLQTALGRVMPLLQPDQAGKKQHPVDALAFQNGFETRLLNPADIIFIDADAAFSKLVTTDGAYLVSHSLKDLEVRLKPFGFVRIHKSHLVNRRKLETIKTGVACGPAGLERPVGRAFKAGLMADYESER